MKSKNYCVTARLDQKGFDEIAARFPDFKTKLKRHSRSYQDPLKHQLKNAIIRTDYFSSLPDDAIEDLVLMLKQEQFESDTAIFREGDPCRGIMYLMEGSIDLCHVEGGQEIVVDTLCPGSYLFSYTFLSGFQVQLTGIA